MYYYPKVKKEMLSVKQHHLTKGFWLIWRLCDNASLLALWGWGGVCVFMSVGGKVCVSVCVYGRIQGKIITVNWPEVLFPLPLPQRKDTDTHTPAKKSC